MFLIFSSEKEKEKKKELEVFTGRDLLLFSFNVISSMLVYVSL